MKTFYEILQETIKDQRNNIKGPDNFLYNVSFEPNNNTEQSLMLWTWDNLTQAFNFAMERYNDDDADKIFQYNHELAYSYLNILKPTKKLKFAQRKIWRKFFNLNPKEIENDFYGVDDEPLFWLDTDELEDAGMDTSYEDKETGKILVSLQDRIDKLMSMGYEGIRVDDTLAHFGGNGKESYEVFNPTRNLKHIQSIKFIIKFGHIANAMKGDTIQRLITTPLEKQILYVKKYFNKKYMKNAKEYNHDLESVKDRLYTI